MSSPTGWGDPSVLVAIVSTSGAAITAAITGALAWVRGRLDGDRVRLTALERRVTQVESDLTHEREYTHKVVLVLHTVSRYIRDVSRYRERHRGRLPEPIPPLPPLDEIDALIETRPSTYNPRDDPVQ